jgi:hypothetical protein
MMPAVTIRDLTSEYLSGGYAVQLVCVTTVTMPTNSSTGTVEPRGPSSRSCPPRALTGGHSRSLGVTHEEHIDRLTWDDA